MKPSKTLLTFAVITIIVGYLSYIYILPGPKSPLMGYQYSQQQTFSAIEIGASKTQLLKLLGEPLHIQKNFSREIMHQKSNFTSEHLAQCIEYITFNNGGNWFYCFGIDKNGIVILKADGHS